MAGILEQVETALNVNGPLLGQELLNVLGAISPIQVWQTCMQSARLNVFNFANYYLRYDITRKKFIRLSPSILRDFMSFTLVSLPHQQDSAARMMVQISNKHRDISLQKISIARRILLRVLAALEPQEQGRISAFIAGDLAYYLGHEVPRESSEIGQMVKGSDIDIVFVFSGLAQARVQMLEAIVSKEKYYYLRHPNHRQEIDFIFKSLDTMYAQFAYADIHQKIASKIAYEGMFLGGSLALFQSIQDQMTAFGTRQKIQDDFALAVNERSEAMAVLLNFEGEALDPDTESLFYFSQERIEFS